MESWDEFRDRKISQGWICDRDDEEVLWLRMPIDETWEACWDIWKKENRSVQYNGKQIVNLKVTK